MWYEFLYKLECLLSENVKNKEKAEIEKNVILLNK